MSVNTAHASNGVLIHAGEYILLHSDSIWMEFSGQDDIIFKGAKQGRIYLTSHRMIFNNKKPGDAMQSFSAPFIALSDFELEQPVFSANYLKAKVRAQPNGNFVGEVKFKLFFKGGGAIEYGQAILRAASTAQGNMRNCNFPDDPPPYTPSGAWHEAPPPAYQPPPGYYGWLPQHEAFSGPAPNSVFVSDNPPPYPGIGPSPYAGQQQPAQNPYQQQPQQPQQHQGLQTMDTPNWMGFSLPPGDQQQQQQQPQQPQQPPPPYGGYPSGGIGPGAPGAAPGYQGQGQGYYAPPYGVPTAAGGYGQPQHYGGPAGYYPGQQPNYNAGFNYPPNGPAGGAMGFNGPPANPKEAEAMSSSYNHPSAPSGQQQHHGGEMPPPPYHDLPPQYDATRKNQ